MYKTPILLAIKLHTQQKPYAQTHRYPKKNYAFKETENILHISEHHKYHKMNSFIHHKA